MNLVAELYLVVIQFQRPLLLLWGGHHLLVGVVNLQLLLHILVFLIAFLPELFIFFIQPDVRVIALPLPIIGAILARSQLGAWYLKFLEVLTLLWV